MFNGIGIVDIAYRRREAALEFESGDALLLEDGTSFFLLEDGTSKLLLEPDGA